ncbi:DUF262 domain-containing protein [Paludibacter jiangxiensis]|uniref:GmrSD restriction endonucleases N-terminal domain-containing protein n=1 Tax=Paludibacter jiangxiensis TaxID=681398 RepID=A0A161LUW4_9BACT|nr:DUF262 domain-containing protein [Paludibacter jiangxiensis]GAT62889.1 hypothetical protein PJIAN_3200 [Paludibacter jiangxiensis]
MATSNISFWQLLEENKISIPIIQRDYAQGRKEESEKRERFLESILKHISKQEKLHLDFVYGRVKNNVFYPIDGQQRLTTLFLIHWYFAIKENIDTDKKSKLIRFVYDTRISSREFCKSIVEEEIKIPTESGDNQFVNYIKKRYWFRSSWYSDPTINAMLIMIQAIHDKFSILNGTTVFQQLTEKNNITFEVLDLGTKEFELTDELYIKMNARGKQLTSFENFKANFIQLIDKYFKNAKLKHPIKGEISYSGYFSYKIEKEWTDLFWAFRDEETIIDSKFFSYFEFVAQMCYFKKYKDAKADSFNNSFSQYEDIFQDEKNLLFLFNSLDKLYNLSLNNSTVEKQKIDSFFQELHCRTQLFWNSVDNTNLFERTITNVKNEDPRNKIILFTVLSYYIKFDTTEFENELQKVVRVIRNLLQATRQRNETKYNTNIRINNFGSYWILLEQFLSGNIDQSLTGKSINNKGTQISDASLYNEIEKASILNNGDSNISTALISLEEFEYFGGLIHLLKPKELHQNYPDYIQYFKEIFDNNIPSSLKTRALIASDFKGIFTKDCRMGGMRYFGKNGNWTTVLTSEKEDVSDSVIEFVNTYSQYTGTPESRLQKIINNWLQKNPDDRTWKYYFIKYPEFTSKLNYYVCNTLFESRILGTEGTNPLVAYHISPYVLTVCEIINNKTICNANDCYLQYSGHSPLILKNGITLTCNQQGWQINDDKKLLSESIRKKYQLDDSNILREIDNRDRIVLAIDFIKDVFG